KADATEDRAIEYRRRLARAYADEAVKIAGIGEVRIRQVGSGEVHCTAGLREVGAFEIRPPEPYVSKPRPLKRGPAEVQVGKVRQRLREIRIIESGHSTRRKAGAIAWHEPTLQRIEARRELRPTVKDHAAHVGACERCTGKVHAR